MEIAVHAGKYLEMERKIARNNRKNVQHGNELLLVYTILLCAERPEMLLVRPTVSYCNN
jgi:hypothetical protein